MQPLVADGRLTEAQLRMLMTGFALYWRRCRELFARAPGSWFAPRPTNVLIVTAPQDVPPYFEPFAGTSLLLYASDLDTHAEYVAFLFAHGERLAQLRALPAALVYNLSYWLERSNEERRAFTAAAQCAQRPDAPVFIHLAEVFAWLDAVYHNPLRAPAQSVSEPYFEVSGASLFVPKRLQPQLLALADAAQAAVEAALTAPQARHAGASSSAARPAAQAIETLCEWLVQARPQLIVRAPGGRDVWTGESRNADAVPAALAQTDAAGIESLHGDLRVVHERTQMFFRALRDPAGLPASFAVLEADGGVYVDAARRAIVYELQQPGFDAKNSAAPPYHRWLLGARVMHEWGHLAHAAKYLGVPASHQAAYRRARAELGACFARVLDNVPAHARAAVAAERDALAPTANALEAALAKKTLARVGDYLANLLCAHLLPAAEMQAYVRANVRHHLDESLGLIDTLARHAYEVHYLAFAGLPRSYFYATSRFEDYCVATGLVRRDAMDGLIDAVGRVLACYAIDTGKLAVPSVAWDRGLS